VNVGVHSRWSWQGLALWAGQALVALAIAAGLVLGPLVADAAWDRGVHVTPAQAAMHYALMAAGFTHHHAVPAKDPSAGQPVPGAALERSIPGLSWGTPITPAVQPDLGAPFMPALSAQLDDRAALPSSVEHAPLTPPPEALR
jgi:hypothetical protein